MKKKVIWVIIAVVIIVAAVMGILYFTTDMFKSPAELFYRHLANDTKLLGKTTYADMMKEAKEQAEISSEHAGEITAKIASNDANANNINAVLKKGKIAYNTKTIGKEQKAQGDITLKYDGKDIVTVNYLKNKEQYGIKVAEAYDKYLSVENNNLKALFQKLGVDAQNVPDKIEMVDYYELLNIDEATLKHVGDTYTKVIKESIPQECYSVEKNVTIRVKETELTTNAYKLTLTEEQTKTMMVKLLETLKTDDTTLNLMVDKYNKMIEPYKMMGMASEMEMSEITKDSLVKSIDEVLEEINNESTNSSNIIEMIVYGAKENKSRIEINLLENGTTAGKIKLDMIKSENEELEMEMTVDDTTMNMTAMGGKEKANVTVKAVSDDAKIELAITQEGKNTVANMSIESDSTKLELNIKDDLKETENITIEDFGTENSVKLNDMTQAEINTLIQTIATNVQKALPQKIQLLGVNL